MHPSLYISFLTIDQQVGPIRNEMSASEASSDVLDRLRIVVIPMSVEAATGQEPVFLHATAVDEDLEKGLDDALKSLIRGAPIACAVSGTLHEWKVEVRLVLTDVSRSVALPARHVLNLVTSHRCVCPLCDSLSIGLSLPCLTPWIFLFWSPILWPDTGI